MNWQAVILFLQIYLTKVFSLYCYICENSEDWSESLKVKDLFLIYNIPRPACESVEPYLCQTPGQLCVRKTTRNRQGHFNIVMGCQRPSRGRSNRADHSTYMRQLCQLMNTTHEETRNRHIKIESTLMQDCRCAYDLCNKPPGARCRNPYHCPNSGDKLRIHHLLIKYTAAIFMLFASNFV